MSASSRSSRGDARRLYRPVSQRAWQANHETAITREREGKRNCSLRGGAREQQNIHEGNWKKPVQLASWFHFGRDFRRFVTETVDVRGFDQFLLGRTREITKMCVFRAGAKVCSLREVTCRLHTMWALGFDRKKGGPPFETSKLDEWNAWISPASPNTISWRCFRLQLAWEQ